MVVAVVVVVVVGGGGVGRLAVAFGVRAPGAAGGRAVRAARLLAQAVVGVVRWGW